MREISNKYDCSGCQACRCACPLQCITMNLNDEGFLYPQIDEAACKNCGICQKVCPVLNEYKGHKKGTAYACYNKNDDVREKSSSGGIFTLIAEYIINQNGIVFGAAFDSDFNVHHIKIDAMSEIEKLQGSKYIQSNIGDTYKETEAYLKSGKPVLFTGTPCQISGLKRFLQKDYENLVTQDIICHGVPSPKVWQKYLKYQASVFGGNISSAPLPSLRCKNKGWKNFSVQLAFDNNSEYCRTHRGDLFMQAFLYNLCLRPSCYRCHSKSEERESDITLADFWGIENIMPDMFDNKGISLALINSEKGRRIFDAVSDMMYYRNVNFDDAAKFNPSISQSAKLPRRRDKFMHMINCCDFEKAVKICTKKGLMQRCAGKAKSIFKQVFIS